MKKPLLQASLLWNGDIQSTLAYFELRSPNIEVCELCCLIDNSGKVLGSGLDKTLIEAQAKSLEETLVFEVLPNREADTLENLLLPALAKRGVTAIGIGVPHKDKKLESKAKEFGIKALWPIENWSKDLIHNAFFGMGHSAITYGSENPKMVGQWVSSKTFQGTQCSKFNSLVIDGPFFQTRLPVTVHPAIDENPTFCELSLISEEWIKEN